MKNDLLNRKAIIMVGLGALTILILFMGFKASNTKNNNNNEAVLKNVQMLVEEGRDIFRFETFGDEAFWTDALQLNKSIAGEANGGVGPGLSPKAALAAGLKVDMEVIPPDVAAAILAGEVDLDDPAVTLTLLKLNAVLGVKGTVNAENELVSVGITCALCHSTVDNAFAPGIGRRLDGWANRDLNVGAVVSLAANLQPLADALNTDVATVKTVLASWGPGKYDAELNIDGKAFRPDGKTAATLLPPAFGKIGNNLHTWTGGWGNVIYWNAYVANLQMHGLGVFHDMRLANAAQYPLAAEKGYYHIVNKPDLITPKLPALHLYQLALPIPDPPADSYDHEKALRGEALFNGKAKCATCHVPPIFTNPGWNTHKGAEIGIDDFQANRGPDSSYVTPNLRGLWTHTKGGFYHDGRFPTLLDVVKHYNNHMHLGLTLDEKKDIVEYLMSLGGDGTNVVEINDEQIVIPDKDFVEIKEILKQLEGIKFYPNPAFDMLKIKISDFKKGITINIYDNSGKIVKTIILNAPESIVAINDLSNGIYVLSVNNHEIGKFVKQ